MATGRVEIRVFAGGVVLVDGVEVPLPPLQRRLLVVLALGPDMGLSSGDLIDRLWPDGAPPTAAASIRNSISRARGTLGSDVIVEGPAGYRTGPRVDTDRSRIGRLLRPTPDRAPTLIELGAAADELRVASGASTDVDPGLAAEAVALRDELVDRWCGQYLGSGDPATAPLEDWCAERPDREVRWTALLAALVRAGRRREAIAAAHRARAALAEFGLEPGRDIDLLERLALDGEPTASWRVDPVASVRARRPTGVVPDGAGGDLIERSGLVSSAVDGLAGGQPTAVVFSGPSGIGKTSVALDTAHRLGVPIRFVRFDRGASAPLAALRRELADAVPSLARHPVDSPGTDRAQFLDTLVEELRVAVGTGAALVLDDLHDGDRLSFVLLRRVLLDEWELPLRIVATVRDDVDRPSELVSLIERATRAGRLWAAPVPGLTPSGVADLVGRLRPDAVHLAPSVADLSSGNPYLVARLVRPLPRDPGPADLPRSGDRPSVSRDELLRYGLLDDDTQAAVEVLAVTGRDADVSVLAAALGVSPIDVRRRLRAATDLELVSLEGDRVAFEHDLVRAALLDGLSADRARSLHAMVALAAEEVGDDPVARARLAGQHWLAAGRPFEGRAIPHLLVAARDAVAQFAYEEAAELAGAALGAGTRSAAVPDQRVAAELQVLLGRAQAELSQFDEAISTFRSALALAVACRDEDLVARAVLGATGAFTDLDVGVESLGLVDAALGVVTGERHRLAILARGVLLCHGAGARASSWAEEAVEIGERLGDAESTMRAMDALSIVLATRVGEERRLIEAARRMREAADAAGLIQPGFVARMRLVRAAVGTGRLDEARAVLDEVTGWPDERLVDLDRWVLLSHRSVHAVVLGDLDEAEDLAVQGRELGVRIGLAEAKPWFALQLFGIRIRQGRVGELASLFAAGTERTDAVSWWLATAVATADADPDRANELVDRFEDSVDRVPRDHLWPGTLALYRLCCRALDRQPIVERDAVRALPDREVLFGAACTLVPPAG